MPSLVTTLGLNNSTFAAGLNTSVAQSAAAGNQIGQNLGSKLAAISAKREAAERAEIGKTLATKLAAIAKARDAEEKAQVMRRTEAFKTASAIAQAEEKNRIAFQKSVEAYKAQTFRAKASAFIGNAASGVGSQIASFAAPVALAFGLKQFTKESVNADIAYQKILKTLEAASGSTEQAASDFEFLRETGRKTGATVVEIGADFAKFNYAAREAGLTAKETRRIFSAFSSAGASFGLSGDQQGRILKALEQMLSKGRVSMEELRQQLGDSLPGAVNLFARAMGVSNAKLFEMIEAGDVMTSEVLPKVVDILEKDIPGGANKTTVALGQARQAMLDFQAAFGKEMRNETQGLSADYATLLNSLTKMNAQKSALLTVKSSTTATTLGLQIKAINMILSGIESVGSKIKSWRGIGYDAPIGPGMNGDGPDSGGINEADRAVKEEIWKLEKETSEIREKAAFNALSADEKRALLLQKIKSIEGEILYSAVNEKEKAELEKKKAQLESDLSGIKDDRKSGSRVSEHINENQRVGAFIASPASNLQRVAEQQRDFQKMTLEEIKSLPEKIARRIKPQSNSTGFRS